MHAYIMENHAPKRIRFTQAQWLLKTGQARITAYYPLTLTPKSGLAPDAESIHANPNKPKPTLSNSRNIPAREVIYETHLL